MLCESPIEGFQRDALIVLTSSQVVENALRVGLEVSLLLVCRQPPSISFNPNLQDDACWATL